MEGVNLKGATLAGSDMGGVNLRVATLKNANLQNCDLRAAVLAGADLEVLGCFNIFFYTNWYIFSSVIYQAVIYTKLI